jgi:ketosteroid isomerase-like protein
MVAIPLRARLLDHLRSIQDRGLKSGDMAYEIGVFQSTANDAQGKSAASVGKFVVNWQKRAGQWKVVADIFNDDK